MLIVEDDADQRELYVLALSSLCEVASVRDAEEALSYLKHNDVVLLLSDWYLPGMQGDELVSLAKREHPGICTILMSTHEHVRATAHQIGADGWYRKNDGVPRLRTLVASMLQHFASVCPPPPPELAEGE